MGTNTEPGLQCGWGVTCEALRIWPDTKFGGGVCVSSSVVVITFFFFT